MRKQERLQTLASLLPQPHTHGMTSSRQGTYLTCGKISRSISKPQRTSASITRVALPPPLSRTYLVNDNDHFLHFAALQHFELALRRRHGGIDQQQHCVTIVNTVVDARTAAQIMKEPTMAYTGRLVQASTEISKKQLPPCMQKTLSSRGREYIDKENPDYLYQSLWLPLPHLWPPAWTVPACRHGP